MWSKSALGKMDMGAISQLDPTILFQAQKDPNFWKAIKEISDSPNSSEVGRALLCECSGYTSVRPHLIYRSRRMGFVSTSGYKNMKV